MERIELKDGAWIDVDEEWLPSDVADEMLAGLIDEEPWVQKPIVVFGREVMQPRLLSWSGDLPYKYSGQTLPVRPALPRVAALQARLAELVGVDFNHVLLNRYRDGRDHMSRHADNEPELGRCPVIAAVSLGVTRRFVLEHKRQRKRKRTVMLTHGSLLVMGGTIQHTWRHAVPRMNNVTGERINLTFRWLRGPPGWRQGPDRPRQSA